MDPLILPSVGFDRAGQQYVIGSVFFDWLCKKEVYMANYDDDYDDTFENGVMRDGARHRVPMHM